MTPASTARALPPALVALSPGRAATRAESTQLGPKLFRLLEGGLQGLVLREPSLDDGPLLDLAQELRERFPAAWLCLHDRVHLGAAAGAEAVHLGWRSLTPGEARGLLPAHVAVGFSSHAGDAPERLAGADYAFLSPLHPVDKPHAAVAQGSVAQGSVAQKSGALGHAGLAREVAARQLPCWALGGVQPTDAAGAAAAGARGLAVLSGLHGAEDPGRALSAYLSATAEHWPA